MGQILVQYKVPRVHHHHPVPNRLWPNPPPPIFYGDQRTSNATLDQQLAEHDQALNCLKNHLADAQNRMKKFADRHRQHVELVMGDDVYLKLRPYRQLSLAKRRCEKLAPKYFGPYTIVECIGFVAYKLELPTDATIHPMFHVSQLKRVVGDHCSVQNHPPTFIESYEWVAEPLDIMGICRSPDTNEWELLLQWKDLPEHDVTWETVTTIRRQFPHLHLEDKGVFLPRG